MCRHEDRSHFPCMTMAEQNDPQEQHPPRWVPYTPPAPDGWDRARLLLRRLSFPFFVVLFLIGMGGVFYWSLRTAPAPEGQVPINVTPPPSTSTTTDGWASLSIRSTPEGAAVRANGDTIGTTPLDGRPLESGVYMLSVRADGYFRADTVLVLSRGDSTALRLALRPRPGTTPTAKPTPPDPTAPPRTASQSPPPTPKPNPKPDPRPQRTPPQAATTAAPTPSPSPPPEPEYGALYITSQPTGAAVTVGGTERGRTPLSVSKMPPGEARVAVGLDGYEDWSTQVAVQKDTTRRVHADLRARSGRLRVLAQPWGTIYINGDLHARESDVWYETAIPAGRHRVTVVHPALGQRVTEVEVQPDEETSVVVDLQTAMSSDSSS